MTTINSSGLALGYTVEFRCVAMANDPVVIVTTPDEWGLQLGIGRYLGCSCRGVDPQTIYPHFAQKGIAFYHLRYPPPLASAAKIEQLKAFQLASGRNPNPIWLTDKNGEPFRIDKPHDARYLLPHFARDTPQSEYWLDLETKLIPLTPDYGKFI